ncbi:hypothetical protein [Streptomyces sp. C184]|uniref:hypothetical protein n=1 Tax=Streptomyces sp. C184 TaxID=3237121 RepID=UPI0034C6AAE6
MARRRWRRVGKCAAWAAALLIVLPVVLAGTALRAQYAGAAAPQTTTRGRDARWLGHATEEDWAAYRSGWGGHHRS